MAHTRIQGRNFPWIRGERGSCPPPHSEITFLSTPVLHNTKKRQRCALGLFGVVGEAVWSGQMDFGPQGQRRAG